MVDYKAIPLEIVDLKAGQDGWSFSAYSSTFNDRDHGGDVILPGAFDRTLKSRKFRPLLWQHDMREPIGIEKSLVPDKKGLLGAWEIIDTQRGQDAYKLLKRGAIRSMSIGYVPEAFEFDDEGQTRVLKDIELLENSVVSIPMNDHATVQSVKHLCAGCAETLDSKAEWTSAYINNLPDSAFAVVEGGGKKDSEGKTVPRSLRHFPHHNAQGGVDLPHLRNALSRAPQSPFGDRALSHLRRHARAEGVGDAGKAEDEFDFETLTFGDQVEYMSELLGLFGSSVSSLLATLTAEGHALNESKRQDLEALLGTFPGLDALRTDVQHLLQTKTDEPHGGSAIALRLALARRRHKALLDV